MRTELTSKIYEIMEREMQEMGPFIVKKQCFIIGADPDDIEQKDLPALAGKLAEVMRSFGGHQKAGRIYTEIKKLGDFEKMAQQGATPEDRTKMTEDLGVGSLYSGEWKKADEYFQRLLKDAEARKDARTRIRYLKLLGFLHQEMADFADALRYYEMALNAASLLGDGATVAECHYHVGEVHWHRGDFRRATESYNKAIESAAGDDVIIGQAHIGIGNIYSDSSETGRAIDHYKEALAHLKKTKQHQDIARAYNNLGDNYLQMGKWDDALHSFGESGDYADKGGWLNMKAWTQFNSAAALISMKRHDEAKQLLDISLKTLEKIGDKQGLGGLHHIYGMYHRARKDWNRMILSYQRALAIYIEIGTPLSVAVCRHELGMGYKEKGDAQGAKEELRLAIETYRKLKLDTMAEKVQADLAGM
ncbi:MAG: tetratricopeptide repeat protein [Euryarchaeota archaeon]|nr:tetratricopeptide repeat protein [Euryarchaeota archaeon]